MISITFDFPDRGPEDLEQLNALLATMRLRELKLEDTEGYLATTRDGEGRLLDRRYGLDSGVLKCELAEDENGLCYRLDYEVADSRDSYNSVLQSWRERHPDRVQRIVIQTRFGDVTAYLIAHHRRV